MTDARHDELVASAAAYALGALDAVEREDFEAHLRTCEVCQTNVDAYREVAACLGGSVEPTPPPAALKARVIAAATTSARLRSFERPDPAPSLPVPRPARFPWLALAASLALAAAAGGYAWMLHAQLDTARRFAADASARAETLRTQLGAARGDAARSARLLEVLTAPDVIRVNLAGTKPGSAAKGQAYWSPSRGLWFTADGLPVLSSGRIYQLWLVLPKQAPISAGLVAVNASGTGTFLSATRSNVDVSTQSIVTVAITEEPASGSPGPTSAILLAGSVKPE